MIDHRLHVLRMVASHGTLTAAAEALSYTPSAVSHQLRSLARDLGVSLLVQQGRGVRLTPAARVLLARTDELYARWEEIRAELATTSQEGVGTLRLCGFSTAAAALLPPVAAHVHAVHPEAVVRIIEADPEDCFDLLLADEADLAVVVATASLPPSIDPRFDQDHLLDDPLDLLLPADHPLAGQPSVLLGETAGDPWILDRPGKPYHQLVLTACAAAGFTPAIAHQAAEWDTGAALVAAGFGVALIPRLARIPAGYSVARVPLRGDPTPARHILTSVRRGSRRQPAIATALEALDALAIGKRPEPARTEPSGTAT
ncbi:MAG: LysR family transcriptional regulator [Nocardioidaceae bacterium]